MKLSDVKTVLDGTFLAGSEVQDSKVLCACDADLVSDVLSLESLGAEGVLLLTSLIGPQLSTMISLTTIKALVFVQGRQPGADFLRQAKKGQIACISTSLSKYEAAGLLFQSGLPGTSPVRKKEPTSAANPNDSMTPIVEYSITAGDFLSAGHVTKKIKQRLENLGVHHKTVNRVAIAAYEAEVNIIIHAHNGKMQLQLSPNTVLLTVQDEGPGIPDVSLAMQEGYSTAPSAVREMGYGAGMGLPNIQRCADDFKIQSEVNIGTRLEIWIHY